METNKPSQDQIQASKLQLLMEAMEQVESKQSAQQKPDWITDKEWEANPNVYHWEQSCKAMELQEQSKNRPPMTREQIVEQARNRRILRGEDPKV